MKPTLSVLSLVLASLLATSAAAKPAEVFAEPIGVKAGRASYALSAFSEGGESLIAFTVQLPQVAADSVELGSCGAVHGDVYARCRYLPQSGELAVVAFRYDGAAFAPGELALGNVRFPHNRTPAAQAPRSADRAELAGASNYRGIALPIDVNIYLAADGLPVPDLDPIRVTVAGPNVIRWHVREGEPIAAITALPGLPGHTFEQPRPLNNGRVWVSIDHAAVENNGSYKYDISVRKMDGAVVTRDPNINNEIVP